MYKKLDFETAENWYWYMPKAVFEHEDITMLWNEGVQIGSGQ
jgi:hypothetical protein